MNDILLQTDGYGLKPMAIEVFKKEELIRNLNSLIIDTYTRSQSLRLQRKHFPVIPLSSFPAIQLFYPTHYISGCLFLT